MQSRKTSDMLAASIFGPEYYGSRHRELGIFDVAGGMPPLDIIDGNRTVLPEGAYIIKYVTGEYMLVGSGTDAIVGGEQGLKIRWHTLSGEWVVSNFPDVAVCKFKFTPAWNVDELFCCELTEPGRIQLIPPANMHGMVSVRVIQEISKYAISNQSI